MRSVSRVSQNQLAEKYATYGYAACGTIHGLSRCTRSILYIFHLASAAGSTEAIAEELYRFEHIANSCGFIYASSSGHPAEVGRTQGTQTRATREKGDRHCDTCAYDVILIMILMMRRVRLTAIEFGLCFAKCSSIRGDGTPRARVSIYQLTD